MASFFPPPTTDDLIEGNCDLSSTVFHVYCNSILPAGRRLATWYQYVNLFVAILGFAIPLFWWVACRIIRSCSESRKRAAASKNVITSRTLCQQTVPAMAMSLPEAMNSFHICRQQPCGHSASGDTVMHIWPVVSREPGGKTLSEKGAHACPKDAFALIDLGTTKVDVAAICHREWKGVVVRLLPNSDTTQLESTLLEIRDRGLPSIAMCHHDAPILDRLDKGLVSGVIVENAAILSNGQRRDYFRSVHLRKFAKSCILRRDEPASFFFAFLELWDTRPSSAVIRRAYKLASHFGAVASIDSADCDGTDTNNNPDSLSAFDYLRKEDVIQMQNAWVNATKQTFVPAPGRTDPGHVLTLDLGALDKAIPGSASLLNPTPLSDTLSSLALEEPQLVPPPVTVSSEAMTHDFWEYSPDYKPLASTGCFPVTVSAYQQHLEAIKDTQLHLKTLGLLQPLKDNELQNVVAELQDLSRNHDDVGIAPLISELVDGLLSKRICVYQGLGSGFTIPDTGAYFWGVSAQYSDREKNPDAEIFVSRQSPSIAGVILHVWLSLHGVPRGERYNIELGLEDTLDVRDDYCLIPLSIRTSIAEATRPELLALLVKLQSFALHIDSRKALEGLCSHFLLSRVDQKAWRATNSNKLLLGEVEPKDVFFDKLCTLARDGTPELPSLRNLCALFICIENVLDEALYHGDRARFSQLIDLILQVYGPSESRSSTTFVDINAELVTLAFFMAMRRRAVNEVYLETTDRCPYFLSQPDQAAVFSELWSLGSQCEVYFDILPRDLGVIIYNEYRSALHENPPPSNFPENVGVWTVYPALEAERHCEEKFPDGSISKGSWSTTIKRLRAIVLDFGSLSIFCLPALVDVCLLSFFGRGLFMTAFMDPDHLQVAVYALLLSLLLTAGVTGWAGSIGNYYNLHYAYDNMVYFHVQRLSGGFVISIVVSLVGFVTITLQKSPLVGLVFVAYMMLLSSYMSLVGVISTMHRPNSPLTSGRTVMWRNLPILFISPIISGFIHGNDIAIYLPVIFGFLFASLVQFRNLCHEYCSWLSKVPSISERDMVTWYHDKAGGQSSSDISVVSGSLEGQEKAQLARSCLLAAIDRCNRSSLTFKDPFVIRITRGLPYAHWILTRDDENSNAKGPEPFTKQWFSEIKTATEQQQQMIRGLKEHSILLLFRNARDDIFVNLSLFLVALMDRWVNLAMGSRSPSMYLNDRSRYSICFAVTYFCLVVMSLDATLQGYWKKMFQLSEEKLVDADHAKQVEKAWEKKRRQRAISALWKLFRMCFGVLGCVSILLWAFVDRWESIVLYYAYIIGYTAVVVFQFNRCFTTNIKAHLISVYVAAALGFITGCILHSLPSTSGFLYIDVIAMNTAALTAAIMSSIWTWNDFEVGRNENHQPPSPYSSEDGPFSMGSEKETEIGVGNTQPDTLVKVDRRFIHNLCLGVDVELEWERLPHDVRRAILNRFLCQTIAVSSDMRKWLIRTGVDMETCDSEVRRCLKLRQQWSEKPNLNLSIPSTKPLSIAKSIEDWAPGSSSWLSDVLRIPTNIVKWIAIISGGGAEVERELWHYTNEVFAGPAFLWILLLLWRVCRIVRNMSIYLVLIYHRPILVNISKLATKGVSRTIYRGSIVVELPKTVLTGFPEVGETGEFTLAIFEGSLLEKPNCVPESISTYDETLRLVSRTDFMKGEETVLSKYHYPVNSDSRWPVAKEVIGPSRQMLCHYDKHGRVAHGTITASETQFDFKYHYKIGHKDSEDLIRADFQPTKGSNGCLISVFWGVPLRETGIAELETSENHGLYNWVSSDQLAKVVRTVGNKRYVTQYEYRHKRDPIITTVAEQNGIKTVVSMAPAAFANEHLLLHKPSALSFDTDDLLIHHRERHVRTLYASIRGRSSLLGVFNAISWPMWGGQVVYRRVSTWQIRTALWNHWIKSKELGATTACWVDEVILREEPILRSYWKLRDSGKLTEAKRVLDKKIHQIVSTIEIEPHVSEVCLLPIKAADLYTMGLGNDANHVTYRPDDCFQDSKDRISVIFNDIGCWPEAPGGVSNCRRDLVNGHNTIRNHVMAESANEYGIPRFQIERNVHSLKLLPLWGLDGKTANHGLLDNLLQSQVDERIQNTRDERDIRRVFIPLLKIFVKGARTKHPTKKDLFDCSNALFAMAKYFQTRDYTKTWNSRAVERAWVDAWLTFYDDPNIRNARDTHILERPSMNDLKQALHIYASYFFIFSVEVPSVCPRVFQSSHHGLGSLFGMILKHQKGVTFGIWDHAILWRETCVNISPAQCSLPLAVQSMILAGSGLAARLAYLHADVIVPCATLFNPVWETEIGSDQGRLMDRNLFRRKIEPILNGISNMQNFQPAEEIRTSSPTVVMLSNIQFIKDIKTAIMAANIIVNKYDFGDHYKLMIYGCKERQPSYAIEMAKLITKYGLESHVELAGFGVPGKVLQDAWLFMNSSISEGLPLAIGEAALAGVPIVATEVGSTALVLTDPDNGTEKYGEVVPPNDPMALARAQLSILSMVGPWARFTSDKLAPPQLPDVIGEDAVGWISKRMYDKSDDRRKLGMLSRQVVLKSFHGERYLREHEQMYWIQWHMARMREEGTSHLTPLGVAANLAGMTTKDKRSSLPSSDKAARRRSHRPSASTWRRFGSVSKGTARMSMRDSMITGRGDMPKSR